MMKFKSLVVILFVLLTTVACSNKYYYVKGLRAAQHPTSASIYNGLTEVTTSNKDLVWQTINGKQYVLAVTWKADTTYYTQSKNFDATTGCFKYNTGSYPVFVTVAPYLKNKHLGNLSDSKLVTRLDQLLGLPPTSHYSYFLEIWVAPEDMIRPCFDPAINVNVCEFAPSKTDNSRTEYMSWLYQYIYNSYCDTNLMNNYPFSHLGYTYDWSPKVKNHVGLSEFVIGQNKNILIKKVYTTSGYFES